MEDPWISMDIHGNHVTPEASGKCHITSVSFKHICEFQTHLWVSNKSVSFKHICDFQRFKHICEFHSFKHTCEFQTHLWVSNTFVSFKHICEFQSFNQIPFQTILRTLFDARLLFPGVFEAFCPWLDRLQVALSLFAPGSWAMDAAAQPAAMPSPAKQEDSPGQAKRPRPGDSQVSLVWILWKGMTVSFC